MAIPLITFNILKSFPALFCTNISQIKLDSTIGQNQLSAWLGALVAFTATTTWKVFQKPSLANLAPGMEKLCQTFLSHLVASADLMRTMKLVMMKGTSGNVINLKKTAITAIVTITTRPALTEKHLNSLILYTFSIPGMLIF